MEITAFDYTILFRLLAAVILGGIIGLERSGTNHEAGLRTHAVLCLGAASVMVISEMLVTRYNIPGEILRMGAQVISGVGFLGAGSIIIDGNRIRGITTAAGVWTTACVGLAAGSGLYIVAVSTAALMMVAMLGLKFITKNFSKHGKTMRITLKFSDFDATKNAIRLLISEGIHINSVHFDENDGSIAMTAELLLPKTADTDKIMIDLSGYNSVSDFSII